MKAFRFDLERILALRRHAEREWEIRLAEVTRPCVELRGKIEDAGRKKRAELSRRFGAILSPELLDASHRYVARLDQETERNSNALVHAEERRAEVQERFLEKQRDRKVLEKLRERKQTAYRKERLREEIAETDEIGENLSGRSSDRAVRRLGSEVAMQIAAVESAGRSEPVGEGARSEAGEREAAQQASTADRVSRSADEAASDGGVDADEVMQGERSG